MQLVRNVTMLQLTTLCDTMKAKEISMPQSVKLSDELIKQARHYGDVYHRSTAKQIEYWSTIGKISEENPDLPYSFIKDILLAQREVLSGDVTPYDFG